MKTAAGPRPAQLSVSARLGSPRGLQEMTVTGNRWDRQDYVAVPTQCHVPLQSRSAFPVMAILSSPPRRARYDPGSSEP